MAYFDTHKTAASDTVTAAKTGFFRLVKTERAGLTRITTRTLKSPEDIVAAQQRAEAHRRKVDTLLR